MFGWQTAGIRDSRRRIAAENGALWSKRGIFPEVGFGYQLEFEAGNEQGRVEYTDLFMVHVCTGRPVRDVVWGDGRAYGNIDMGLDHLSRIPQLYTTLPHRGIVPTAIRAQACRMLIGACDLMLCSNWGFRLLLPQQLLRIRKRRRSGLAGQAVSISNVSFFMRAGLVCYNERDFYSLRLAVFEGWVLPSRHIHPTEQELFDKPCEAYYDAYKFSRRRPESST